MAELAEAEVGPTNLATLAVGGISKYAGERVMSPIVGNANLVSGAAKLAVGVGMDSFTSGKSPVTQGAALGVGIDGIEDILTVLLGSGEGFGAAGDIVGGLTNSNSQGTPGSQEVM